MGFSLGEWIQTAVWDVKAFFGDDDAKAHAEALREVNSQSTPIDRMIYNVVESEEIEHTGIVGGLDDIGDTLRAGFKAGTNVVGGLWKNLSAVIKGLPFILILVGIAILTLYLWPYINPKRRVG